MTNPIDFSAVGWAIVTWLASPTFVLLASLSWLAFTLANIAARASETDPDRKDKDDVS